MTQRQWLAKPSRGKGRCEINVDWPVVRIRNATRVERDARPILRDTRERLFCFVRQNAQQAHRATGQRGAQWLKERVRGCRVCFLDAQCRSASKPRPVVGTHSSTVLYVCVNRGSPSFVPGGPYVLVQQCNTCRSSCSSLSDAVQHLPRDTNSASGLISDPTPRRPARMASNTTVPPPTNGSEKSTA